MTFDDYNDAKRHSELRSRDAYQHTITRRNGEAVHSTRFDLRLWRSRRASTVHMTRIILLIIIKMRARNKNNLRFGASVLVGAYEKCERRQSVRAGRWHAALASIHIPHNAFRLAMFPCTHIQAHEWQKHEGAQKEQKSRTNCNRIFCWNRMLGASRTIWMKWNATRYEWSW